MELTPVQEETVRRIMTAVDCPKDFRCHEEGFENMCRTLVHKGANAVQCKSLGGPGCPMSYVFSDDILFCRCRLRRYVALELGK